MPAALVTGGQQIVALRLLAWHCCVVALLTKKRQLASRTRTQDPTTQTPKEENSCSVTLWWKDHRKDMQLSASNFPKVSDNHKKHFIVFRERADTRLDNSGVSDMFQPVMQAFTGDVAEPGGVKPRPLWGVGLQ